MESLIIITTKGSVVFLVRFHYSEHSELFKLAKSRQMLLLLHHMNTWLLLSDFYIIVTSFSVAVAVDKKQRSSMDNFTIGVQLA